ncbi:MAG: DUF6011 domain-containing protein [Propionibacteriaceae bacterium]|nr:DUF6011 domain-containing protein [Propionibacteriaceae bacterium]
MISTSERQRVFIDADVLAHPVSRSLILFTSIHPYTPFTACWSLAAEAEADAALASQWEHTVKAGGQGRSRPLGVAALRKNRASSDWAELVLVADATNADMAMLVDTSSTDRHILAAAHAAGCRVVVTQNVRDFGRADLDRLNMVVVCPDVFLSVMVNGAAYTFALESIAAGRSREPRAPAAIHQTLGRSHPRLVSVFADLFPDVTPAQAENQPAEVFRGSRCLACGKQLTDPASLSLGVGPECHRRSL